jgi:hypothetical protein
VYHTTDAYSFQFQLRLVGILPLQLEDNDQVLSPSYSGSSIPRKASIFENKTINPASFRPDLVDKKIPVRTNAPVGVEPLLTVQR